MTKIKIHLVKMKKNKQHFIKMKKTKKQQNDKNENSFSVEMNKKTKCKNEKKHHVKMTTIKILLVKMIKTTFC